MPRPEGAAKAKRRAGGEKPRLHHRSVSRPETSRNNSHLRLHIAQSYLSFFLFRNRTSKPPAPPQQITTKPSKPIDRLFCSRTDNAGIHTRSAITMATAIQALKGDAPQQARSLVRRNKLAKSPTISPDYMHAGVSVVHLEFEKIQTPRPYFLSQAPIRRAFADIALCENDSIASC